ncbi:uncharacterized protein LOC108653763 [Drosophila navojoa]|uniref:uncharacterized protein LOC108653763 n=1 Tax=Drosophila navojoa TaxID=7232 RepID=UPI0008470EDF|nr:uncharacterized protein LOC108653763 [Drosophila navojoa]
MVLLKKFCCVLKLRTGCYLIAVVDLIINLNIIIFSGEKKFKQVERGMAICHCIGCTMLIIGAIVQSTVLLTFFLITCLVNSCICVIMIIMLSIHFKVRNIIIIVASTITIFWNIYCWILVFSYYRKISTTNSGNA